VKDERRVAMGLGLLARLVPVLQHADSIVLEYQLVLVGVAD
jgi:hypothetical protein